MKAMSKGVPTLLINNERVRVTEWRFAPGAATGWHRHAMDYVVVPMRDGVLELVGPDDARSHPCGQPGEVPNWPDSAAAR